MVDRLERLMNLVALLLDTSRPLTFEEIVDRVPGYAGDKATMQRLFERDKDTIRSFEIPITTERAGETGHELAYQIRKQDYELKPIDFTDEERSALHVAMTAVHLEGGQGVEALWKLGGLQGPSAPTLASIPVEPCVAPLFEAERRHLAVRFTHRGVERRVEPHGLVFRHGHWYLIGNDLDVGEVRSFRTDRIDPDVWIDQDAHFEPPASPDLNVAMIPTAFTFGDDPPVAAQLLVDRGPASEVVGRLGESAVLERRPDGSIVVELAVTNREGFRSYVAGFGSSAEILGPPALRDGYIAWLGAFSSGSAK